MSTETETPVVPVDAPTESHDEGDDDAADDDEWVLDTRAVE